MSTDLAGNVQQGEPEVAALLRGRARCYDEEGLLSSHLGNRKRFYHIRSIGEGRKKPPIIIKIEGGGRQGREENEILLLPSELPSLNEVL